MPTTLLNPQIILMQKKGKPQLCLIKITTQLKAKNQPTPNDKRIAYKYKEELENC